MPNPKTENSILNSEGLLDVPSTSNADYEEDIELTSEKDLLGESDGEKDFPCLPTRKSRTHPKSRNTCPAPESAATAIASPPKKELNTQRKRLKKRNLPVFPPIQGKGSH